MRGKRIGISICIIAVAFFTGCSTNKYTEESTDLYADDEARAAAYRSYDQVMGLWETAYTEDWVDTDYGRTHIIIAGPEDAQPVFLLPGLFADATMWYANASALAEEYRVYAVDLLVFGGKGEPSDRKIADITDYAAWFQALLDQYGYDRTAVAGLSYGSWLSLALAREIPQEISAVIMLDPSETFMKMSGIMAWQGFRYFMLFPSREKYREFFSWIGGGFADTESDIWLEHMIDVIEYGTVGMMDVPQHRVYAPEELTMVDMPVLILAGGKPIIYKDPGAFALAAGNALPHAQIALVEGTGHSLNVEKPDEVNSRMLTFLRENYHRQGGERL